jgi:hypothetical protein
MDRLGALNWATGETVAVKEITLSNIPKGELSQIMVSNAVLGLRDSLCGRSSGEMNWWPAEIENYMIYMAVYLPPSRIDHQRRSQYPSMHSIHLKEERVG